jgi:predicted Zn-dependent protease with MMP-like domain
MADRPAAPAEFEALIDAALRDLPESFRSRIDTVAIVIDDEASAETLARMGVHGLFGLYEGVPRTAFGASGAPAASKITIFRRPIEARYPDPARRAAAVRDTLFHEIAHHFGISDARLREINAESRRRAAADGPSSGRSARDGR